MKKIFGLMVVFAVIAMACDDAGELEMPSVNGTFLIIINHSSYELLNVKYNAVDFGDINIGSNKAMNVSPNTPDYIYFDLVINNNRIQCRTNEAITCNAGNTESRVINNTTPVTVITGGRTGSLREVFEALSSSFLVLKQGETVITSGSVTPFDFGTILVGNNRTFAFTIENNGNIPLELTGNPVVESSNSVFAVSAQPANKIINPGDSIQFVLRYQPTAERQDNSQITIANNSNHALFSFNVTGNGSVLKPIVEILYNNNSIPQNGTINAGNVTISEERIITVTIGNKGDAVLTVGSVNITGDHADAFIRNTSPDASVQAGSNTSFVIRFVSAELGEHRADLRITTNDNSRNPVIVSLRALVVAQSVFTVTFESNGGSAVSSQYINSGTAATQPDNPSRAEYSFDNWYSNSALTTVYNFASPVTGDITLYAKWNINQYTVTFNSNGGTIIPNQTVNSGGTVTSPQDPTRDGHTFDNWYSDAGFAVQYNFSSPVTGNITLFARWNAIIYTITFNANNATSGTAPAAITANSGSSITLPGAGNLARTGLIFNGWNTNASGTGTNYSANTSYTVNGNITLFARWDVSGLVPGAHLVAKLTWLNNNATSGANYIIEVNENEIIGPQTLSYSGRNNISITLRGIGAVRNVSLSANGAMFTIGEGVTLVLDNNITLQGRDNNTDALVSVAMGGTLLMNSGSTITGNRHVSANNNLYVYGGGVRVAGSFTMNGGTISGNSVYSTHRGAYGGGVSGGGTFTMNGGTISGNTAYGSIPFQTGIFNGYGGGVYFMGRFTKTGGTIFGYTAGNANSNSVRLTNEAIQSNRGHAVYAENSAGTFIRRKESNAGTTVNLSFNGGNNTASGSWD